MERWLLYTVTTIDRWLLYTVTTIDKWLLYTVTTIDRWLLYRVTTIDRWLLYTVTTTDILYSNRYRDVHTYVHTHVIRMYACFRTSRVIHQYMSQSTTLLSALAEQTHTHTVYTVTHTCQSPVSTPTQTAMYPTVNCQMSSLAT